MTTGRILITITALLSAANLANAQVPSSLLGNGFFVGITGGISPFASYGYYLLLPANSGNTYQTIGIYNSTSGNGTYSYVPTGPSTAIINFSDSVAGLGTLSATFATTNSGSSYTTASSFPGAYQTGNFVFSSRNALSSVVGKSFLLTVSEGTYPFATSGSFGFYTAVSGNTFTTSDGGSGTYSYSLINRSVLIRLVDKMKFAMQVHSHELVRRRAIRVRERAHRADH